MLVNLVIALQHQLNDKETRELEKDEEIKEIREDISKIVHSYKSVLQMHGFYLNKKEKSISFDIIIDFSDKDKEKIYNEIYEKVSNKYSEYNLNITMDFDVSD